MRRDVRIVLVGDGARHVGTKNTRTYLNPS